MYLLNLDAMWIVQSNQVFQIGLLHLLKVCNDSLIVKSSDWRRLN